MSEYDEDIEALVKRVDKVLKKHDIKPGMTAVSIDEPGKITRFTKRKKEDKENKLKSAWLIEEGYGFPE